MSKNIIFRQPGHFYCPLPDRAELVDFLKTPRFERQIALVDEMLDYDQLAKLWSDIKSKAILFPYHQAADYRYYAHNNQFLMFDAVILSALLRHLRPKSIIEIGSGFSSAAIFDTIERSPEITIETLVCIDPDMSRFDRLSPPDYAQRLEQKVQNVDITVFDTLGQNDILFIDSSHVLKTGSDVHYEFLYLLPRLKVGSVVHIHDIFYPFEYPPGWMLQEGRAWNENYLVNAILSNSDKWEIMFFNHAMVAKCPEVFATAPDLWAYHDSFPIKQWQRSIMCGSLWLRKVRA